MGNIVLLDDLTINKIAAGEVIERPASVVKELVENSIDAGSTKVNIEVKNGGISYIRITDNGKGISPDDMEIAFERHATSKIRSADDLNTVMSMGFRGEALASIASIARVELVSRKPENEIGYRVVIEGGKILEKGEIGCPAGTTITVENLFFNTPVRYKFLKKDYTEFGYIEDFVTRLALVNTNIAIKLINSGKTIIQTPGDGNIRSVLYNIYGKEVSNGVVDVDYIYEDIKVKGVAGKPEIARSNKSNQMYFVNKRYVKDKTLSAATEQAYKGLITIGKFGFCILDIEIKPEKVDVNVHPAKLEVRFEEESKVFKAVYHSIKNSLLGEELVKNTEQEVPNEQPRFDTVARILDPIESKTSKFQMLFNRNKEKNETIQERENVIEELFKSKNITEKREDFEAIKVMSIPQIEQENKTQNEETVSTIPNIEKTEEIIEKEAEEQIVKQDVSVPTEEQVEQMANMIVNQTKQEEQVEKSKIFDDMYTKLFGKQPIKDKQEEKIDYTKMKFEDGKNLSVFEENEKYNSIPNYKVIGVAFSTYIILELKDEMYILDQHAAHERIMYESVKKNFYDKGPKDSQLMLVPDVITLTHKELSIVKENINMFEQAGFTLEEFGENTIKLTGVPNICMELNTKQLFLDILDEIDTVAITARQEKEDKFIATIACKAAVKANMKLDIKEIESLMQKLLVLPNPFTCPHGRPTAIKMTKTDIEKKFSRR